MGTFRPTTGILSPRAAGGFTLLEVLVALLILSFGLIGLAMLQTVGLKFNTNSATRTQSTFLAYDIIDRMRANPSAISGGLYDVADTSAAQSIIDSSVTDCATTACSSAQMAAYDLKQWYSLQDRHMPGASASTDRSTIKRLDPTSPKKVTITLRWVEDDLLKEQNWVIEL
jgi:type IV pilus assembly protein PilV